MNEPRLPERQRLELSFVRARWLAAVGIAALAPLGDFPVAATAILMATVVFGNAGLWRLALVLRTLGAQRRLGVGAVVLDAALVLGAGLAADEGSAAAAFSALVIVVAEVSVRFAPLKALGATAVLISALAATMGVRTMTADDAFDLAQFGVIATVALLVGTMVGSAVREVYRQGVAPQLSAEHALGMDVPEDAASLLTPRERQVLSLIARGYSNPRIAEALVIEQKTVKNHINRIYDKLEINSRYEAITTVLGQRREGEPDLTDP